ncbi:SRPBCC domain-containing protein [Aestuariibius insulae]|uniref:SRPBCC domain-containing protein n=1 Tax=Aestuariibius insulae TaxID=2058287 RepID=UPI00345EE5FA
MKTSKPIEKTITVPLKQEEAYDFFTNNLDKWWPSLDETVDIDPKFGGIIQRNGPDEGPEILGRITHIDPGKSLTFTWQKGDAVVELLLTFTQTEDGTRVDLIELPLAFVDAVAACRWIPSPDEILLAFRSCAVPVMA